MPDSYYADYDPESGWQHHGETGSEFGGSEMYNDPGSVAPSAAENWAEEGTEFGEGEEGDVFGDEDELDKYVDCAFLSVGQADGSRELEAALEEQMEGVRVQSLMVGSS